MMLIGLPYSQPELMATTTGGTPYGASHLAGHDGSNAISDDERALCGALGRRIATTALQLKTAQQV